MTETELSLIAAPAMIGLSSKPKNGYITLAASRTSWITGKDFG